MWGVLAETVCRGERESSSFLSGCSPLARKPTGYVVECMQRWFGEHTAWKQPGRIDLYLSNNPSFKKIYVYNLHICIPKHGNNKPLTAVSSTSSQWASGGWGQVSFHEWVFPFSWFPGSNLYMAGKCYF